MRPTAGGTALVGYTGFVGGNLHQQHRFEAVFNTTNIGEIAGTSFDLLVLAATQAKRWWANLHPAADREGIERLLGSLQSVAARRVVLISTIDVLPPLLGIDESFDPHGHSNHAYGANRLGLEDAIKAQFARTHVVRLPSLYGPGLKKNVIYDLLNGNQLEKINPEGSFQYYDLGCLWEHISLILHEDIPLIHLFPEPVTSWELVDRFFAAVAIGSDPGPASHYAFKTRYAGLFGGSDGYIWPREEVFRRIGSFIESLPRWDDPMKLAISNIAWDSHEQDAVLALLRDRGVGAIEIAPTKLWPEWAGAVPESAAAWRRTFAAAHFDVPAMQAILFGKPDLQIFGPDPIREATLDHIRRVAGLAAGLGAQALVFGSPRNRGRGSLSPADAFSQRDQLLSRSRPELCGSRRLALHRAASARRMTTISSPTGVRLPTSSRPSTRPVSACISTPRCIQVAGDDPCEAVLECRGMIRHFHVSEPHLADFSAPVIDHARVGEALRRFDYRGWISIEMRRPGEPLARIAEAVEKVSTYYGDG